jgi:subtilisin family serine protease
MGHGSMVASVAATSNGVAPGALLGSYRVFGCSGYAVDDIIIEAIDRAVQDGCDVINLSLASGSGFASTVCGWCCVYLAAEGTDSWQGSCIQCAGWVLT